MTLEEERLTASRGDSGMSPKALELTYCIVGVTGDRRRLQFPMLPLPLKYRGAGVVGEGEGFEPRLWCEEKFWFMFDDRELDRLTPWFTVGTISLLRLRCRIVTALSAVGVVGVGGVGDVGDVRDAEFSGGFWALSWTS